MPVHRSLPAAASPTPKSMCQISVGVHPPSPSSHTPVSPPGPHPHTPKYARKLARPGTGVLRQGVCAGLCLSAFSFPQPTRHATPTPTYHVCTNMAKRGNSSGGGAFREPTACVTDGVGKKGFGVEPGLRSAGPSLAPPWKERGCFRVVGTLKTRGEKGGRPV